MRYHGGGIGHMKSNGAIQAADGEAIFQPLTSGNLATVRTSNEPVIAINSTGYGHRQDDQDTHQDEDEEATEDEAEASESDEAEASESEESLYSEQVSESSDEASGDSDDENDSDICDAE